MKKTLISLLLIFSQTAIAGYVELNDIGEKRSSYKDNIAQSTLTDSKVPQIAVEELPTYSIEIVEK